MKQFDYKSGIAVRKHNNQHTPKAELVRNLPKEVLTPLEKYQKACDLRDRQKEIKKLVCPLMAEYRSISQKMDEYFCKKCCKWFQEVD